MGETNFFYLSYNVIFSAFTLIPNLEIIKVFPQKNPDRLKEK